MITGIKDIARELRKEVTSYGWIGKVSDLVSIKILSLYDRNDSIHVTVYMWL